MRLVYFGTADFAVPALVALRDSIELVVSQPDRPSGRGLALKPSPVKRTALDLGLPVETPEKSRSPEFVERIRALDADVLVVAAYGQILSQAMLESAKQGAINLHGSILPKYRGAAPIQRCLLNGDTETGVTLMQMDKGMDTGGVIAVQRIPIGPDETAGELFDRLAVVAGQLANDWIDKICSGNYHVQPQDEELATMAPKVTREETALRTGAHACDEYNRFRAFTPFPGAYLDTKLGRVKLDECRLSSQTGTPGMVLALRPELTVAFQGGSLLLRRVRPEGKRAMTGSDWANGARLSIGDCLSE